MRCPPCSGDCNQGRVCPTLFTHEGAAVVDRGQGLHMPTEATDEPIIDAEGAQFWSIVAFAVVVFLLAIVGLSAIVHFVLRY